MWSSLLMLALLGMVNPVRLGVTALVISRPRPLANLFAYWIGSLTSGVPALLVPLTVLHVTPVLRSFTEQWAAPQTSSTVAHVQVGIGVLMLAAAAVMTVGLLRRRELPLPAVPGGAPPPPPAPADGVGDGPPPGSAVRRLLHRGHHAWEGGSLWVAWLAGLAVGPGPDAVVFALAIIVASGAAFGAQVVAALGYVLGMLAVVEVILVSHLVAPVKTQAALRRLHEWASAHRTHILVAILAVLGLSLIAHGTGVI